MLVQNLVFPGELLDTTETVRRVAKEVMGEASGKRKASLETWWWNASRCKSRCITRKTLAKQTWERTWGKGDIRKGLEGGTQSVTRKFELKQGGKD